MALSLLVMSGLAHAMDADKKEKKASSVKLKASMKPNTLCKPSYQGKPVIINSHKDCLAILSQSGYVSKYESGETQNEILFLEGDKNTMQLHKWPNIFYGPNIQYLK